MREKDNRIGYVSLFIIVIVGLNLNFSIQAHDKERRDFCISKGFSGYDHDFIPQIYFCYKQNGEKIYMASYAGNYSLFDPAKSCDTLQFKESKICEFFFYPEMSCKIPRFKFNEQCI